MEAIAVGSHVPDALAAIAAGSHLNRQVWDIRLRSQRKGGLTISAIISRLGLKRRLLSRGIGFDHDNVRNLHNALSATANVLPKVTGEIVDVAVAPHRLSAELGEVLDEHGEEIWGGRGEREWMLEPGEVEGYTRELDFWDLKDRALIKEYLRLWIIVKAIDSATPRSSRNTAPKMSDYETEDVGGKESGPDLDVGLGIGLAMDDRAFWEEKLSLPFPLLNVLSIIETLGLDCIIEDPPGYTNKQHSILQELEMAVQKASEKLTQNKEGLLWAADHSKLMGQVNYLLLRFGQHIWDRDEADDLKYHILEDRVKISDLLRQWIIVQALDSFKIRKIRKSRTVSRRKAAKSAISQDVVSEVEDVSGDEDDLDMELIDEVNTDHDVSKDSDSKPKEQNTARPVASKISIKAGDETESNVQDNATGKSKSRGTEVHSTLKTVAELDAGFAANLPSKTIASETITPKSKTRKELDATCESR
jgi:hypothetical protein